MSSTRLLDLLRTTGFRLSIAFLLLFTTATIAFFLLVDWQMKGFLGERSDEWLSREMKSLSKMSPAEIALSLEARAKDHVSTERPFSLFDVNGNLIAGPKIGPLPNIAFDVPSDFAVGRPTDRTRYRGLMHRLSDNRVVLIAQSLFEQSEFEETLGQTTFAAAMATTILGLLGAAWIGVGSVKRLDAISETTRQIMNGDLRQRLSIGRMGGDIDRISSVVNDMLDEIERLMHEVKGVCDNIAHDMRTPLTRLLGGLERARRRSSTSDEYAEAVDEALVEIQGILKTFSAMLRISEIEDGVRRSGFVQVDLNTIASDVIDLFEPAAEERGIALELEQSGGAAGINGDPSLLFEAVANLVDNALKFTPEGGRVSVSIRDDHGVPSILVEDSGPGIPVKEREAVLQRFYRSEPSRHAPGNGLGLSLVAAVARLHGMTVAFDDGSIGGIRLVAGARG